MLIGHFAAGLAAKKAAPRISLGTAFGPKPAADTPPVQIAGPALAMWLLVAWAYWFDRNRTVVARDADFSGIVI